MCAGVRAYVCVFVAYNDPLKKRELEIKSFKTINCSSVNECQSTIIESYMAKQQ